MSITCKQRKIANDSFIPDNPHHLLNLPPKVLLRIAAFLADQSTFLSRFSIASKRIYQIVRSKEVFCELFKTAKNCRKETFKLEFSCRKLVFLNKECDQAEKLLTFYGNLYELLNSLNQSRDQIVIENLDFFSHQCLAAQEALVVKLNQKKIHQQNFTSKLHHFQKLYEVHVLQIEKIFENYNI